MPAGMVIWPIVLPSIYMIGLATVGQRHVVICKLAGQGGEPLRVTMSNLEHTKFIANFDGSLQLDLTHSGGRQELTGDRATRALATLLAGVNQTGGSKETITAAVDMIADAGGPRSAIELVAREAERRASPVGTVDTWAGDYLTANGGAPHRLPAT